MIYNVRNSSFLTKHTEPFFFPQIDLLSQEIHFGHNVHKYSLFCGSFKLLAAEAKTIKPKTVILKVEGRIENIRAIELH